MPIDKDAAAEAAGDEDLETEEKETALAETDETEGEEADAEEESSEEEGEKAEGEDDESEDDGKKPGKAARRRARDKAKIATLEEIARHESQRADAAASAEARLKVLEAEVGKEPKESDYTDEKKFIAAYAAWESDMRAAARQKRTAEAETKDRREAASASKYNLFRERVHALSDSHPGIEAAVFAQDAPFNQVMADVLMDSERGAETAHYLATHREEARRIQQMTPLLAARELGRLEAKLDVPKAKTQTTAPKPVPKVGGGSAKAAKDPDKMTMDEWTAWRNAQLGLVPGRKKAS